MFSAKKAEILGKCLSSWDTPAVMALVCLAYCLTSCCVCVETGCHISLALTEGPV